MINVITNSEDTRSEQPSGIRGGQRRNHKRSNSSLILLKIPEEKKRIECKSSIYYKEAKIAVVVRGQHDPRQKEKTPYRIFLTLFLGIRPAVSTTQQVLEKVESDFQVGLNLIACSRGRVLILGTYRRHNSFISFWISRTMSTTRDMSSGGSKTLCFSLVT